MKVEIKYSAGMSFANTHYTAKSAKLACAVHTGTTSRGNYGFVSIHGGKMGREVNIHGTATQFKMLAADLLKAAAYMEKPEDEM